MSVHFKFTGDNSSLRNALQETTKDLKGIEGQAEHTGAKLQSMFQKGALAFGAYFGGRQLLQFAKSIAKVRAEFQDAESTMAIFLKSGEKASDFIGELQKYAYHNMFEFSDLVQASQQLLAFGNDINTVIPIIDQLSNVASGTKKPLEEYIALYNKAKSTGTVQAMDLQSWAGKGVVIADELQRMGVEVDRSAIKFEHLQMVINNLTSEGGLYHNLMASQMSNISAEMGQLQDNIALMFNEIGKRSEGAITTSIKGLSYLVEHWEKILGILTKLVAAYGIYRTTLIAYNAIQASNIKMLRAAVIAKRANIAATQASMGVTVMLSNAELVASVKTNMLTKAKLGLAAAMKKVAAATIANPVFLIAGAIAGLAFVTYKLITAETAAEKTTRLHNEALEEQQERYANIESSVNNHIRTIRDTTASIYAQVRAYEELGKALPEFAKMSIQEVRGLSDKEFNRLKDEAMLTKQITDEKNELIKREEALADLRKRHKENQNPFLNSRYMNQKKAAEGLIEKQKEQI